MNKQTITHLWNKKKIELKNGRYAKARELDSLIIERIRGKKNE